MECFNQSHIGRQSCLSCHVGNIELLCAFFSEGIYPGQPDHNIDYRHAIITLCNTCNCAQVERLFHDCFDFEEVFNQYTWYTLNLKDSQAIVEALKECPEPYSTSCNCRIHSSLRSKCDALPRSFWSMGIESDEYHVYHISLSNLLD